MTTPQRHPSVEEVAHELGRFTVDRVKLIDDFGAWQYGDTSHTKLSARHLSQDTRDELAGVLPTPSQTKRSLHMFEDHTVSASTETQGTIWS